MSDVSVIGLGEMGSSLAAALLAAGRTVTVWNRTPTKAIALQHDGARLAASPGEAVTVSPIVLICVSDYSATATVLDGAGVLETLHDRLVVQLTSGTPRQARGLEARITAAGGRYLDGAIAAWPRQIGTPEAAIVVSGPQPDFEEALPTLKLLTGEPSYVGPEIGSALALFNAALAYLAGHWIGFSHGAAVCEAEGLPVELFGDMMADLSPSLAHDLRHMGRVISKNQFDHPESTLRTAAADIARLVDVSHDLNIGCAWPSFATSIFQRAIDEGLGEKEHCAITKVLGAR
jgi:3-hydroxyisobutyrate dehydrogenase-like beta-hydroxyacid dehydrogenase